LKAFLVEMTFLSLHILSVLLNKVVKHYTKATLLVGWHWFTPLAVQAYKLSSKLPTQTHQLDYLASRTSFYVTITSYRKHHFYTSPAKTLMLISPSHT